MHLKIITHDRIVFDEDVNEIYAKGVDGEFGILKGHIPIVSALELDELVISTIANIIINRSKYVNGSLKYTIGPRPMNFIINSAMKIPLKTYPVTFKVEYCSGVNMLPSRAMMTLLVITIIMIKISKNVLIDTRYKLYLIF